MLILNRTTNEIFKFIHKTGVSSLSILYNEFPNKNVVDESYNLLINDKLIVNRDGSIELTVDGYDYFYNQRKRFFMNILKIIIVPIIIAVISTLLTNLITISNNNGCNRTCNCGQNTSMDN